MNRREVKRAPVLRFKGFTNDWEQRKLKKLGFFYKGKGYTKKDLINDGVPILLYGELYTHYSEKISNTRLHTKLLLHSIFSAGNEVVLPDSGETSTDIARASWISNSGIILAGGLIIIKPNEYIFPGFLAYSLTYGENHKLLASRAQGKSIVHIHANDLKTLNIIYPENLKEQQRIFALLEKLNKCIALQQRKVKMLILLKKEISNYYFSPSYLSRSCKENSFKEIFTVVTDYVANGSFKSLRENVKTNTKQGYAYMIRLQDASNNWKGPWLYTDKSGYNFLKKSKIYPGDIVMSNVGSVGKIIRIPKLSKPMTLAPNAILLRSTKYDNDFLYELLKSDYGKNKIKRMTTPGVQNKINKTDFKKIKVHLPNSQEQKRISCLLTNMNILIHEVKSNISQKQKLKQFLLQNMFI